MPGTRTAGLPENGGGGGGDEDEEEEEDFDTDETKCPLQASARSIKGIEMIAAKAKGKAKNFGRLYPIRLWSPRHQGVWPHLRPLHTQQPVSCLFVGSSLCRRQSAPGKASRSLMKGPFLGPKPVNSSKGGRGSYPDERACSA